MGGTRLSAILTAMFEKSATNLMAEPIDLITQNLLPKASSCLP